MSDYRYNQPVDPNFRDAIRNELLFPGQDQVGYDDEPVKIVQPFGEDGDEENQSSSPPGPTGARGPTGATSTVPGPTGPAGPTGAPSTIPGPTGPAGPTGAASMVPGPTGPRGPTGGSGFNTHFWAIDKDSSQITDFEVFNGIIVGKTLSGNVFSGLGTPTNMALGWVIAAT